MKIHIAENTRRILSVYLIFIVTVVSFYPLMNSSLSEISEQSNYKNNGEYLSLQSAPLFYYFGTLEYSLAGLSPFLFHAVNVIFHCLNAIIIFFFCNKLWNSILPALVCSLFFALHPAGLQWVTRINQQDILIYSSLILLMIYFYQKYLECTNQKYFFITNIFFALSYGIRFSGILPVIILLGIDFFYDKKNIIESLREKKTMILIMSIAFIFNGIDAMHNIGFTNYLQIIFKQLINDRIYGSLNFVANFFSFSSPLKYQESITNSMLGLLITLSIIFFLSRRIERKSGFYFLFICFLSALPIITFTIEKQYLLSNEYFYIFVWSFSFLIFHSLYQFIKQHINTYYTYVVSVSCILVIVLSVRLYSFSSTLKDYGTLWTAYISYHPEKAEGYLNRGKLLYSSFHIPQALRDLKIADSLSPNNAEVYLFTGLAYATKNLYDSSILYIKKAIEIDSIQSLYFHNLGVVYIFLDNNDSALFYLNKSIQLSPKSVLPYCNRASIYVKQNNYVAAFTDYTQALQINPLSDVVHLQRALVWLEIGNYSEGKKDLEQIVKIFPDRIDATVYLGLTNLCLCDTLQSFTYLKKAYDIDPISAQNIFKASYVTFYPSAKTVLTETVLQRIKNIGYKIPVGYL